jgi:hypothetical protein
MPDNMPSVLLDYTKTVTKPLADPSGGKYAQTQSVELTSATEEATIYYSLDGSDPRTNGTLYTGKISVSMGSTLKAFAKLADCADSDVMIEKYEQDDDITPNDFGSKSGGGCNSGNFIFLALILMLARKFIAKTEI